MFGCREKRKTSELRRKPAWVGIAMITHLIADVGMWAPFVLSRKVNLVAINDTLVIQIVTM